MVFFDTCVWLELLALKTPNPADPHEVRQATEASELLSNMYAAKEKIISCKEQLVEIIKAVEKIKYNEANRNRERGNKIHSLKSFRSEPEFQETKELYASIIADIRHFAIVNSVDWRVEDILSRLDLADINDCIYYDYCMNNEIDLYTFDNDLRLLGENPRLHIL